MIPFIISFWREAEALMFNKASAHKQLTAAVCARPSGKGTNPTLLRVPRQILAIY